MWIVWYSFFVYVQLVSLYWILFRGNLCLGVAIHFEGNCNKWSKKNNAEGWGKVCIFFFLVCEYDDLI